MSMLSGKAKVAFIGMLLILVAVPFALLVAPVAEFAGFVMFAGMFILIFFGFLSMAEELL